MCQREHTVHPRTGQSLAEYYYRTSQHLLNGVAVIEIDVASGDVRTFGDSELAAITVGD
jgi:hypothetical protein